MKSSLRRSQGISAVPALILAAIVIAIAVAAIFGRKLFVRTPSNLVLISIDTLRSDRLASYGYSRVTSPAIDALAEEGTVFEKTITTASWTLPSHVSMLSGLYPHSHGVQRSKRQGISPRTKLLTEVLDKEGYKTIGITGGAYVSKRYGFDRGFDFFRQLEDYAPGDLRNNSIPIATKLAASELSKVKPGDPFFLFLHTYDVHCPYDPPEGYNKTFTSDDAEEIEPNHCGETYYNVRETTAAQAKFLGDRYDDSIRAVDDGLSQLFTYLKSRPDYDRTVIVITSDHGEEFLEHGRIGHQKTVHREVLYIPFIVRAPGTMRQRVPAHVSLIDLYPTVLDLVGVERPADEIDGVSLSPFVRGAVPPERLRPFEFSEVHRGGRLYSRIDEDSHLIINEGKNSVHFYDLQKDPAEQKDLAAEQSEWFRRKHDDLKAFIKGGKSALPEVLKDESDEERQRLKSLGYL